MPKKIKREKQNKILKEEPFVEDDISIEIDNEADQIKNSFDNNPTKKLRDNLKKCIAEKQEYLDGWQRAKADLINLKRDFEEQKKGLIKFAKGDLIVQLIPILDSFDMAFLNTTGVPKQWLKGVEYIQSQFTSILEENGVKQINPEGEKFDLNEHIAIKTVKVDDEKQASIILKVIQKGYKLDGKILREARVQVGEFKK